MPTGIPTLVFEGTPDSPTPAIWWQTVEKYGVTVLFSAPTAMRVLRKFDEKYLKEADLTSLKHIFLAGEPLDEPTYSWATRTLGKDIIDHYWQTESGLCSPPRRLYHVLKQNSPSCLRVFFPNCVCSGWAIITNHKGIDMLPIKPGTSALIGDFSAVGCLYAYRLSTQSPTLTQRLFHETGNGLGLCRGHGQGGAL